MGIKNPRIKDAKKEFEKYPVVSSLLSLSASLSCGSSIPAPKRPFVQHAYDEYLEKKEAQTRTVNNNIELGQIKEEFIKEIKPMISELKDTITKDLSTINCDIELTIRRVLCEIMAEKKLQKVISATEGESEDNLPSPPNFQQTGQWSTDDELEEIDYG